MSADVMEPKQTQTGYELTITRVFDAPRELVWKAWTDPEMAKQWSGPRGFTTTEFNTPRTAGGHWHLKMEGRRPGSEQMSYLGQGGTVLEFDPPQLLKYTFAWDQRASVGLSESPYKENVVTVRFEELGNKTVMQFTQAPFATEGERDGHNGGWNSAFDRFAEFMLAEQPHREPDPEAALRELHLKRFFAAPRQMVYEAWTKPEMVAQWWGPRGFTSIVEQWEAHSGGAILVTMHGYGMGHPMSGKFVEVLPPYRFHFTAAALDADGKAMFENWNSVFLEEVEGGTMVTVDVYVMNETAVAPQYLKGMSEGWSSSLEKLGELVEAGQ